MKLFKVIVLVAIIFWIGHGLHYTLTEYLPALEKESANAQIQQNDQEITPEMDRKIKKIAEKAAVIFVHTIFGPLEEIANDVAKRHPELQDRKPVVVDGNFQKLITSE